VFLSNLPAHNVRGAGGTGIAARKRPEMTLYLITESGMVQSAVALWDWLLFRAMLWMMPTVVRSLAGSNM
jgi:hypothetical protein